VGHVSQILPEGSFSGLLEPNKIAEEDTTTRNIHFRISGAAPVFAYFKQSLTGSISYFEQYMLPAVLTVLLLPIFDVQMQKKRKSGTPSFVNRK
jgi:hypothetical protein